MNSLSIKSIVVGMDIHKYNHTAVAMNVLGKEIGSLEFDNENLDICIKWLKSLGNKKDLFIGLENIDGYGFRLARQLTSKGFNFYHINPILTKREKKYSIHKEKTDYIDAKEIGIVILNKFDKILPATTVITEDQENLRLIDIHLQERDSLIKQRTKLKNRFHNFLHQYYGNKYKQKFKNIFTAKALKYYEEDIKNNKNDIDFLSGVILRLISHLKIVKDHIKEIDKILIDLGSKNKNILILKEKLLGCGFLTACQIIAEIKDINKFSSQDKLARFGGFAPIKLKSGRSGKLITDRYGDRKFNKSVHHIALTQIGRYGSEAYKSYYRKKVEEGKSKLWALRCLKRQIVKNIFNILKFDI